jgi:hypothetical protein
MISIRRTTLALSIAALLAVPAVAHGDVGAKVSKSARALDAAVAAAKRGDAKAFKASARKSRRSARAAAAMARHARGAAKRAKLLRRVAAVSDRSVDKFAGILDVVPPQVQGLVVGNLELSAEMRERLADMLLALAERLPEPARTQVIEAVAAFSTDGEIGALFEALASDDVLNGVKDLITAQIESLSAHLDSILGQIEELAGTLPPGAAEALNGAISMIQGHLAHVGELINGLFDGFGGLGGGGLGGGGFLGGFGGGSFCGLLPIPLPLICD